MKKLFVIGFVFAVALSANASYLCWQINAGDTGMSDVQAWAESGAGIGTAVDNWNYATITIKNGSGDTVATGQLYNNNYLDVGVDTSPIQIDLGSVTDKSAYSYYIEIANTQTATVYGTQSGTYADMSDKVYDNAFPISDVKSMQAAAWHGSIAGYKATPEPTSAMLMLLGVAGLALRRKQRKA